jgi:hypothetical protein
MGEILLFEISLSLSLIRYSSILFENGLTYTPLYFYEQASHIRGPQTNFTVSPRSLNGLLATLKILELEQ